VSILLPLLSSPSATDTIKEMCHVKLNLESGIVEFCPQQSDAVGEEKLIVSKKMTMKGLSIDVNRVVDRISPNSGTESPANSLANQTRDMFDDKGNVLVLSLQHLLSNEHEFADPSLLSPVDVSLTCSLWNLSSSSVVSSPSSTLPSSDAHTIRVKLEIHAGPIEIWPRISQLILLKSAISQFEWECKKVIARQKCFHLRPLSPPSVQAKNSKSWWRYALLWELLRLRNWDSPEPLIALFNLTSQQHTHRHYKQRYLHLYRKHIEGTLRQHAASSLPLPPSTTSTNLSTTTTIPHGWVKLSIEEEQELDFLHRLLDEDKLLLYRLTVHQGLQEAGITLKLIRDSIHKSFEEPSLISFSRLFFGQQQPQQQQQQQQQQQSNSNKNKKLSKEKVDESVDAKILSLLDDVKSQLVESKRLVQSVFDTEIFLPGISIILSNSNETTNKISNMSALFMLSQLHISFQQYSTETSEFSMNIGGVRIYGLQGFELLSSGLVTELPLNSVDQAIHFKVEWKTIFDDDPIEDNSVMNLGILQKTSHSTQHAHVSMLLNTLTVKWNENAINLLQHDLNEYMAELCLATPSVATQSHPYSQVRLKCAQFSMTNSPKFRKLERDIHWSFIFRSQGITLDFPLGDSSDPKPKSTLLVSFASFQASMEDCLLESDPLTHEVQNSLEDTLTRSLWPQVDQILRLKYLKLNHSIIDSISFSLEGLTLGMRRLNSPLINFIQTPWCMKGLFSHCLLPCHKSYPENQFDLYCSPLVLSLKLKVTESFILLFISTCLTPMPCLTLPFYRIQYLWSKLSILCSTL
jgi:hypothetical protein